MNGVGTALVGVTISQVIALLGHHLQTRLSADGLMAMWMRLALILEPWYEQLGREARASAKLHADETGWRVNGQTHWLWCFANDGVCFYMIDRSRGSPALAKFFLAVTPVPALLLLHDKSKADVVNLLPFRIAEPERRGGSV